MPEFSNDKQKAIAIFNNAKMKARQDLMVLQPTTLLPAHKTTGYTEVEANSSPLMDKEIVDSLLKVLEQTETGYKKHYLNQQKAQILKTINTQIEVVGQKYLDFLKEAGYMDRLIKQLHCHGTASSASEVVPAIWIEAKIQKMRKLAIESTKSLSVHNW